MMRMTGKYRWTGHRPNYGKSPGRPIQYFAFPFGLWDREALEHVKERGFKAAFQLSEKRDEDYPQFCIRRIIVPGEWSTTTLQKWMKQSF